MSASSQLSCPPDANSAVVYKTAALPARTLCTPVSSGVPARPAQGHGLATDPGHSFAARDRVANVRRSSSVSRTTTGKGIRDSGLQTASFILPAPDRTASPFGADSDWRTGMADMCAVHDAPRLIVLEHRVGREHFSSGRSSLRVPLAITWRDRRIRPTVWVPLNRWDPQLAPASRVSARPGGAR